MREGENGLLPEAIAEVTGVRLQPLRGNVNFNCSHRCLLVGYVGQGHVGVRRTGVSRIAGPNPSFFVHHPCDRWFA
jgi:hypothetical protein